MRRRVLLLVLTIAAAGAAAATLAGERARRPAVGQAVTVPVSAPRTLAADARVSGPAGRPLVVIDPGHGGHDPGAVGADGTREKDVTLALARAVRDRLLATGRVRVALTRNEDHYLFLPDRFGIARMLGAGLFLSLHADSANNEEAEGATLYTLSAIASDREAARLAARENRVDLIGGGAGVGGDNDVAALLLSLTQRDTMDASARFARLLRRESPQVPFRAAPHRVASLMVLKAPDVPSVLYEVGYLSHDTDAAWLASDAGRAAVADGIADAVAIHFATRRPAGRDVGRLEGTTAIR